MEDIIVSLEPAFHRIERFILWHNQYASLLAFIIGHCIFYAIARIGLRPFCATILVILLFHILDCFKKKRSHLLVNEEKDLSELTQLILRSYRHIWETHDKLNTLKTENRAKYSILIIIICLILGCIGLKISGFYVSYIIMLMLFTLPAIVYHKLIPKLLQRLSPLLEQLDRSMEYKRRSLLNQKDLLVKIDKIRSTNDEDDDDDEEVKRLRQEQLKTKCHSLTLTDDEDEDKDNELKLIDINDQSQTILNFRQRYQNELDTNDVAVVPVQTNTNDSSFDMLSDSSSSIPDDEATRINDLYANVSDQIDGKHRIKIKGDEFKIKGRSNRQRPKLMDAQFFQSNIGDNNANVNQLFESTLINTSLSNDEPDLASFDFLDEYNEKE